MLSGLIKTRAGPSIVSKVGSVNKVPLTDKILFGFVCLFFIALFGLNC